MPIEFGTAEWARALRNAINASSEFRNAAAKWGSGFNGDLLFAFEPDGSLAAGLYLFLRLKSGSCGGAEFVAGPKHEGAGFALRASYSIWRDILAGKTTAATAILTGKLRVEGDKITLLKYAGAHRALIHCVASLDTLFPGA